MNSYTFLFFYIDAGLSVPNPVVTSFDAISESSLERPEESVSDVLFCCFFFTVENRD